MQFKIFDKARNIAKKEMNCFAVYITEHQNKGLKDKKPQQYANKIRIEFSDESKRC